MKEIRPGYTVLGSIDGEEMIKAIEAAGRTCYKSESQLSPISARKFVQNIIKNGHESVLEHEKISVRVVCDRGVTHEIVRHRIASYSQESTRYCNYSSDKFGNELTFIIPFFFLDDNEKYQVWQKAMQNAEDSYMKLIELGATPQEARTVLPNSLKTEIVITMNLREWRHFFKLRTDKAAHPQMREVALDLLSGFKSLVPVVFDDIPWSDL
ncbi:FAD-dependent thymidylate synthase [Candidatus Saccharibacteria bacterium]|nr:FAD-dependent thymidylate synthase [Candidatus Saccharibacteria bacterium]